MTVSGIPRTEPIMVKKYTYFFGAGETEGKSIPRPVELLGNKGAQLQAMTALGLPVPPGFTISTEACSYYFDHDRALPRGLLAQVRENVARLEKVTGLVFGDSESDPLLVSARSGAAISMPGMMETILNIGLTDRCVDSYIRRHDNDEKARKFILDCYRRLYEMFGENVYHIDKKEFRDIYDALKAEMGVTEELNLSSAHLESLIERYRGLYRKHNRRGLPQDPALQLREAIGSVFDSALGEKARSYLRDNHLPERTFTGVTVQAMVYGNENAENCGTGVAFTRDPVTGVHEKENPYGEFLLGGQGEDVVSGRRNVYPIGDMKKFVPQAYDELLKVFTLLEQEMKHVQDVEFTVWRGKLYMLQTRNGKMTGRGNIRSSYDMVQEGLIPMKEAVMRVTTENMQQLLHPMIDEDAMKEAGVRWDDVIINPGPMGVAASPGAGVGRVVFDVKTALAYHARGEPVVLCRVETDPADYLGMVASQAVATARGGKTSHAAVVARNKGIPCAAGTGIAIDEEKGQITYRNRRGEEVVIKEGDFVSVDGSRGKVLHYQAKLTSPDANDPDLQNFLKLLYEVVESEMESYDTKMHVYANANDDDEAKRALQFGAEGIGLARTERMFLEDKLPGENRALTIQSWVLAKDPIVKEKALKKLEEMQTRDFLAFYQVMQDKPVIIRLLDYPLHELLSNAKNKERLGELTQTTGLDTKQLIEAIDSYQERNPMLGQRSIRLAITHPEIFRMQARAIFNATKEVNSRAEADGRFVTPYIELSQVFLAREIMKIGGLVAEEAENCGFNRGGNSEAGDNRYRLGIMFELAGASFEADNLAQFSDFGSFGTNDLTQTVMGWSREDGSTTFLPRYLEAEIIKEDPFITIDRSGPVAKAMALAVLQARSVKPDYEFGICGEHAADPDSLEVCYGLGLNNVSPGPNQVPIAWLKLAQLLLTQEFGGFLKEYARVLRDYAVKISA
ncbi:MAG: pyruvate, phosphate dikinase [Chloroflexota bacterium]